MKTGIVNSTTFHSDSYRIDPDLHLGEGVQIRRELHATPYELSTVGENASRVFYGNIFSRVFVKKPDHGVPYLAASDTVLSNLNTGRFLSKKQATALDYLKLKKDWILVTCSGTLGNVTYTNKVFEKYIATHDLIRVVPNDAKVNKGTLHAFLSSRYGYYQITQSQFGGVVKHVNDEQMRQVMVPVFPTIFQQEVNDLIQQSAKLREEAATILMQIQKELKEFAKLPELTTEDYDFYGVSTKGRKPSVFIRNKRDITSTTINAFNHSIRIRNLKAKISKPYVALRDTLVNGDFFTTGSFSRQEAPKGKGVMLINQSDIFDFNIKGKSIYKKCLKNVKLVDYGEVLVAGVGTLGENETFCRCVFANESLQGQLVSGEFLRMKTIDTIPSGYLFAWLSSDYGFRLIRSTQSGTKQCRPIQKLLLEIPVPLLTKEAMLSIDEKVRAAHTLQYQATINENKAITMVEEEIEKWQSPTA